MWMASICIIRSIATGELLQFKRLNRCFYIVQYPVRWTAHNFTPWQTFSFRHQLHFSAKHSSHTAITHEDYSLTFPPLYRQVLIYRVE